MKKHPYKYNVTLWFCGGHNDEGLEAKAFKGMVERKWPKAAEAGDVVLDHFGVGDNIALKWSPTSGLQNWKLAWSLTDPTDAATLDALESTVLGMLNELAPTLTTQVEIGSEWLYR